ncbi:hypothetical protein HMPREF9080_01386 [Cardiobacterium valvarum F0432]|uniref:Uncharacterized protein n=1 Tax=Cardiobacterium valvarum F0432 TaxID=797473 RepID=G9ZF84_9GAMM|nr:hypothetical protein HMPREF9080_01386 [Cardiobacterium valvarum F0432]
MVRVVTGGGVEFAVAVGEFERDLVAGGVATGDDLRDDACLLRLGKDTVEMRQEAGACKVAADVDELHRRISR